MIIFLVKETMGNRDIDNLVLFAPADKRKEIIAEYESLETQRSIKSYT